MDFTILSGVTPGLVIFSLRVTHLAKDTKGQQGEALGQEDDSSCWCDLRKLMEKGGERTLLAGLQDIKDLVRAANETAR